MHELIRWNKAKQAIIEAKSIDEVKSIKDKAEVMRAYAKQVGESLEVQNNICEIKLRAERKMGVMLKETELNKGAATRSTKSTTSPKLEEIGINKYQSSKYQKIADLPEEKFEEIIEETKEAEKELTEVLMVSTAKKIDMLNKINKQKKQIEQENIKQPKGNYDVIVIDPPWAYDNNITTYDPNARRVASPYPEMSMEKLKDIILPVKKNCILWLWTTNLFMEEAYQLLDTWNFQPKTILTWDKQIMGIGYWLRNITEHCIFAIKGKPTWNNTAYTTLISEKRREHSRKPEKFYEMVNKLCVGRKLDYFSREKRKGWECFGNDTNKYSIKDD